MPPVMPDSATAIAAAVRPVRSQPSFSSCKLSEDAHVFLATFPHHPAVPDTLNLRPATRDELTQPLSFALQFNGRRHIDSAGELMAQITAERLGEYLERADYVIMHKPSLDQHGAAGNQAGWIEKATKSDRGEQRSPGIARSVDRMQRSPVPIRPFSYVQAKSPNGRCWWEPPGSCRTPNSEQRTLTLGCCFGSVRPETLAEPSIG